MLAKITKPTYLCQVNPPQPKSATPAFGGFSNRSNQEDVIVLGLEWSVSEQELREYFEEFGSLTLCEVRREGCGPLVKRGPSGRGVVPWS